MKKLKYFNTPEGQIRLRLVRLRSWFYATIDQEPKSKASKQEEKIYFQTKILEELKKYKKRAYISPIVLQIDFYTSQKTPPGIHNLAKNYLDLLQDPVPGLKIKCKKILYNNDRQIKLLIINYHLGEGPAIHIHAETLRNFICDLDLFRRIEINDFEKSQEFDNHEIDNYKHKLHEELYEDDFNNEHFTMRELKELRDQKDIYVKKHGLKFYLSYEDMIIRDIQSNYLKSRQLTINWLTSIFPSYYLRDKSRATGIDLFEHTAMLGRNFVGTLGIPFPSKPTEEGKTKVFKEEVKKILEDFKRRYPILFPLKSVLGVTILFLPPKNGNIDLDNLARKYIVPFINDIIQPPRNYAETVSFEDMPNDFLKKHLLEELEKLPKEPHYSIVQYQIIEVPRVKDDLPEGYIRLLFNDGSYESNLWIKLKHILDKWKEHLKDY